MPAGDCQAPDTTNGRRGAATGSTADRYRVLLELASDAILLIDHDTGRILEANNAAATLYGYTTDELRGLNKADLSAEPVDARGPCDVPALEPGTVVNVPLRFHKKKDGTVFPTEITGRFVMDHDRLMHIAAVRDITSRWQAERALQESEERFRTILQHAPDGVIVQVDQRIAYLNAAALKLLGALEAHELLGTAMIDRCHPDFRDQVRERNRLVNQERQSVPPMDQVYLRVDGSTVPVEVSAAPINYLNRPGSLMFVRDITRRKRLEGELAQAQRLDSIGRIAGGIAHDFNNMLNVIGGYTEMALARVRSEDPLRAQLLEVKQAADRAAELTGQLLAFSRRQTSVAKLIDLNQRLRAAEGMIRRLLGEAITLRLDLWEGSAVVRIDPAQLDQLIINLVSNCKDAFDGPGAVHIETDIVSLGEPACPYAIDAPAGPYVLLSITDNGAGMDAESRDHLFEPFFAPRGPSAGSGLGMAVVYGVVKQHLGAVDVSSSPGHGTTIRIFLPRQEAASLPGLRETRTSPASTVGKEVVLVVEDEEQVRKLVAAALERAGYVVLQAGAPEHALDIARSTAGPIDLLVTDVIMPDMDGAELQRRILRIRPRIRTLFMSGYASNIIGERGILDDGVYFIQKPFSVVDLMRKVRELLG